jgi:predicted regulator of Ras-like GTPase activity (Roadblock/LC7/MglB family)
MTKADLLAAALDDFLAVSPDVEAAAIVSADGLPMASALPPYVEEDRLAAMSAALLTLGERAADGLGKGELAQVFVEGDNGYVVLMSAGHDAVLVAVTSRDTKVGLVLFEMRKAAQQVQKVMDEPAPTHVHEHDTEEAQVVTAYEGEPAVSGYQDDQAAPAGPVRTPEPTPAAETESSLPSWQ